MVRENYAHVVYPLRGRAHMESILTGLVLSYLRLFLLVSASLPHVSSSAALHIYPKLQLKGYIARH